MAFVLLSSMDKFVDLTGQRFGKLVVLERKQNNKYRQAMWLCKCDCGNMKVILSNRLRIGHTKSCGCLQREKGNKNLVLGRQSVRKHGLSRTKVYNVWKGMIDRCYNEKSDCYKNYGGRGIKVCDEWLGDDGLLKFYDWAFENGYKEDLSLDRMNNDGNYEPSNCHWATKQEQARNRRTTKNNRLITYKGETHSIFEWLEILGIKGIHYYEQQKE